jgi:hypothetical protein
MKKLTLIFTLLVSTVMFSSPSYAKWTKIGKSVNGDTSYVDFERIRKVNGYVYYWDLVDFPKPEQGYLSASGYQETDCKLFRKKTLTENYFTDQMGRGTSKTDNKKNPEWVYPPPNSVIEVILKSVCSR